MSNINLPLYDKYRDWIRSARVHGKVWSSIKYALKSSEAELELFLNNKINDDWWPAIDLDTWYQIVQSEENAEIKRDILWKKVGRASIKSEEEDNDVTVPTEEKSSWQLYKKHLLDSGWKKDSVDEIESATIGILKRLNDDTVKTGAIKGLVIGHVQSGKTANMAGLMAMAADWGWNLFIVLSGTIENLRKQTQSRLFKDLYKPGNITWNGLEHLSKKCDMGKRAQDLRFEDESHMRYFTVCLKNSSRLTNLIEWMQYDPNKYKQMKVIVIDDEADQASVNTADVNSDERAKINKLIVNLVEGNKPNGSVNSNKIKAMNYISYTATPYANFLNEATPESLYPKNFIRTLQTSNEYFGPAQIFGIEGTTQSDGLNIIREISGEDLNMVTDIHKGDQQSLPNSLKESICWFLCAASSMRVYGYTKPISMLVHTSQKQDHHKNISDAIKEWVLKTDRNKLIAMCKSIWEKETKKLTISSFRETYPDYGCTNEEIKNYPTFTAIVSHIDILLEDITHIPLGEDGELKYHPNIHLCVDNCANNGVNEDGMTVRLAYPDSERKPYPTPAPVFIIVGGSTLSRGLTIEGLVSTYFLRSTGQADSLMQMGRWFGYRKGYELLPRIWMTRNTIEKFEFLALLEKELRDDLHKYMVAGADPSVYGPRVKNTPKPSWMRITAKNKMQSVSQIEMDFSGVSSQTVLFDNDINILRKNITVTENFIKSIGSGQISQLQPSFVWRNINFSIIYEKLFKLFTFQSRSRVFNQMDAFCEWIQKVSKDENLGNWNVVVIGTENKNDWLLPSGDTVGMSNRSKKKANSNDKIINIGTLRTLSNLMADIDINKLSDESKIKVKSGDASSDALKYRSEAGLDNIPLLLIYRIDKNSKPNSENSEIRENLNSSEDIIGISITIPGAKKGTNLAKALTIKITKEAIDDEGDLGEE